MNDYIPKLEKTASDTARKYIQDLANDGNTRELAKFSPKASNIKGLNSNAIEDTINSIKKHNNLDDERRYLEDQLRVSKETTDSLFQALKNSHYINLKGFMIAELQPDIYEFANIEYNMYSGAVPTSNHALLVTKSTTFSSKGFFSIYARKATVFPLRLKEEFGGFKQNADVYEEVTSQEIEAINERNKKLYFLMLDQTSLNKKLEVVNEKLSLLLNNIRVQTIQI